MAPLKKYLLMNHSVTYEPDSEAKEAVLSWNSLVALTPTQ